MGNKHKNKKHNLNGPGYSSSANNVGTVGHIGYGKEGGKGSYKKLTERLNKLPNTQGIGENEEFHTLY